jgi:signal transduction histidine kinase
MDLWCRQKVLTSKAVLDDGGVPPIFGRWSAEIRGDEFFAEQETTIAGASGNRSIGIWRGNISDNSGADAETIWILRDITEQKRLAGEREAVRRSVALAEIATVLAHEIRNPLGSMELFTGLLADATAHLPETRQWVTHLQAALRALSPQATTPTSMRCSLCKTKLSWAARLR